MRPQIVVTALLICAIMPWTPALAQTSTQFQTCSKSAMTQLALDMCAGNELALRNKQMRSVYSEILSHAVGQPATLAKVKAMQQRWFAYAAAYLEALYPAANKRFEYGSMYPMEFALARAELVAQHIMDLKAFLANLKNRSH